MGRVCGADGMSPAAPSPFATIDEALEDIRQGKMVVVCDDEDRENEGDLTLAAQFATPEAVNFMAKEGRGLICLALTPQRCDELGLDLMAAKNESPFETAFTVSVEARDGITTGISAADLIAYRRKHDKLVERVVETRLPTGFGEFAAVGYRSLVDQKHHVALVKGDVSGREDVLVRVHSECLTGDVFHSLRCDCGEQLESALAMIERE